MTWLYGFLDEQGEKQEMGILHINSKSAILKLQGYVDANLLGDIDSRKSTTGFIFTLGGTAISWVSNLQKIITYRS